MKKIGIFILLAVMLAACSPRTHGVQIAQTNNLVPVIRMMEEPHPFSQGVENIDQIQIAILALLILFLVVPIGLMVCIFIRLLGLILRYMPPTESGGERNSSVAHWNITTESNLYQQMALEQQWLFSEMLTQIPEEAGPMDVFEPPANGWN